jgi:hypothetical protein
VVDREGENPFSRASNICSLLISIGRSSGFCHPQAQASTAKLCYRRSPACVLALFHNPPKRLLVAYLLPVRAAYPPNMPPARPLHRRELAVHLEPATRVPLECGTLHALNTQMHTKHRKARRGETERMHNMSLKPSQLQCRQTTGPLKQSVVTRRLHAGSSPQRQARLSRRLTITCHCRNSRRQRGREQKSAGRRCWISQTVASQVHPVPITTGLDDDEPSSTSGRIATRVGRKRSTWHRLLKRLRERRLLPSGGSSQMRTATIHASAQHHKDHPPRPRCARPAHLACPNPGNGWGSCLWKPRYLLTCLFPYREQT